MPGAEEGESAADRWTARVAAEVAYLLEHDLIEPTGETLRGQVLYRLTPKGLAEGVGGRVADG